MRLVLLPAVAGISYEVLRLSAKHGDSGFSRALIAPGLLLQRLPRGNPISPRSRWPLRPCAPWRKARDRRRPVWDKLETIQERVEEITRLMGDPAVTAQPRELQKLGRELSELRPLAEAYAFHRKVEQELEENRELAQSEKDPEMRTLAREEVARLAAEKERLDREIRLLLLPKDPNDEKNIMIEIRAGAGGEEAALFAAELSACTAAYAELKGWKVEMLTPQPDGPRGASRRSSSKIHGRGAYSRLKYESGVHRVQRVPVTEAGAVSTPPPPRWRCSRRPTRSTSRSIPTTSASTSSTPAAPAARTCNTTRPAVRITHVPTGLRSPCQDETLPAQEQDQGAVRSSGRACLDLERREAAGARRADMRSQVGTGDASGENPHLQLPAETGSPTTASV